jgi:hypothetical protein
MGFQENEKDGYFVLDKTFLQWTNQSQSVVDTTNDRKVKSKAAVIHTGMITLVFIQPGPMLRKGWKQNAIFSC